MASWRDRWLLLWQRLRGRTAPGPVGVDIVIPIYGARQETCDCIESVLRHARGDWRLLLVDDASPDPQLVEQLREFAANDPRITLHCRPSNRGFVATANHGMERALRGGRDVLLLNSDTVVTRDFLGRLRAASRHTPSTGIITPLTNNGTICSIPRFMEENQLPAGISIDAFADAVAAAHRSERPALVTAVGFCMYIRLEVLRTVGLFREELFGAGYGEENDLCERAKKAGFEIRLCDDLFIYHAGSASFGDEADERREAHNRLIGEIHPNYHEDVQRFIRENPLAETHDAIRASLARHGIPTGE